MDTFSAERLSSPRISGETFIEDDQVRNKPTFNMVIDEFLVNKVKKEMDPFKRAIDEFLANNAKKETDDSKNPYVKELLAIRDKTAVSRDGISQADLSVDELQAFVVDLEGQRRAGRGYRILHKVAPFMEALKNLLRMCESMAQMSPFGVGAAFAGVRVILELAVSQHSYFDAIVEALDRIRDSLVSYQKFGEAFSSSPDFQKRLVKSYIRIIEFWYNLSRNMSQRKLVFTSLTTSLMADTKEAVEGLKEDCRHIESLAHATESLRAKYDREQKVGQEIRRWIRGNFEHADVREDQNSQSRRRQAGTCCWLIEDERFVNWRDGTQPNALLWYNAKPGSGKTVMASAVVEHLINRGCTTAWWYFSFNNPWRKDSISFFRSLALQLLTILNYIPDSLKALWEHEMRHNAVDLQNVMTAAMAVHALVNHCGHIHIVVDGIDECADVGMLLEAVSKLIQKDTRGLVKWMFASQDREAIRHMMETVKATEITPTQDAIMKDVQTYFAANLTQTDTILQYTDREDSFLYARFVCETLKGDNLTCDAEIEEALDKFPKDLTAYYTRFLENIAKLSDEKQELARRIFVLVVGVLQPITLDEAIDALSIHQEARDYDPSRVPRARLIEELCGPLLTITSIEGESKGRYLRLYHKAVHEFFLQDADSLQVADNLRKFFKTREEIDLELGLQCLTYLNYDRYTKIRDLSSILDDPPKQHSFLRYATTFWFQHLLSHQPTADAAAATKRFLESKALWTCVGVQARVSPYLFGRYASEKRKGVYKMGVRGVKWHDDDWFGVPLPQWLDQHSDELALLDRSLCCFIEEWREVLVMSPEGLHACVPLTKIDGGCYLTSSSKTKSPRVAHLGDELDVTSVTDIYRFEVSAGKPLWVNLIYQSKGSERDVFQQLRIPLFSSKCHPISSTFSLPVDAQSTPGSYELVEIGPPGASSLEAWSVDQNTSTIRRTGHSVSEQIKLPLSMRRTFSARKRDRYELVIEPVESSVEKTIQVFRVMWRLQGRPPDGYADSSDHEDDDTSGYASSDGQSQDEDAAETSNDDESDDDESDSDDSTIAASDGSNSGYNSLTSQDDDEDDGLVTDSFLIATPRKTLWIDGWVNRTGKWANISLAVHPFLPLVAVSHTAFRLELLDLEKGTQKTRSLPEMADLQETPVASSRELRFSPCGNYLHFLLILFVADECGTKCHVKLSTFSFNNEGDSDDTLVRSFQARSCTYKVWDTLHRIANPLALTFWSDDVVIIALPPLTCDPKILKIKLPQVTNVNGAAEEDEAIFTLSERIYFPTTITRRSHKLVYRSGSEGDDDYIHLCLGPLLVVSTDDAPSRNKPPVVLRWKIPSKNGWQAYRANVDQKGPVNSKCSLFRRLRGSFVSESRTFHVPIRGGLNWNRKGFLSCA